MCSHVSRVEIVPVSHKELVFLVAWSKEEEPLLATSIAKQVSYSTLVIKYIRDGSRILWIGGLLEPEPTLNMAIRGKV